MNFNFFHITAFIFCTTLFTHINTEPKSMVLIIMGASCAGKSTVSKQLLEHLGTQWKLIELDTIENTFKANNIKYDEAGLIKELINKSNNSLENDYNLIIDTNIYNENFNLIRSHSKKIIFIYCPLNTLMERNQKRDCILKRNPQRSKRTNQYVKKTFYNFEKHIKYDLHVDSSILSLQDILQKIFDQF